MFIPHNARFEGGGLLRVCKQINHEATEMLLANMSSTRISLYTLHTLLPVLNVFSVSHTVIIQRTLKGVVTNFPKYAMHITIKKPGSGVIRKGAEPPVEVMLTHTDALFSFCLVLAMHDTTTDRIYRFGPRKAIIEISLNSHLGTDARGVKSQTDLLEILAIYLWSFANVKITGAIDKVFSAKTKKQLTSERWPPYNDIEPRKSDV